MEIILVLLIVAILNGAIAYIDGMMEGIAPLALNAEHYMTNISGTSFVEGLTEVIFGFGVSLIIIFFPAGKKGLENGDNEELSPFFGLNCLTLILCSSSNFQLESAQLHPYSLQFF